MLIFLKDRNDKSLNNQCRLIENFHENPFSSKYSHALNIVHKLSSAIKKIKDPAGLAAPQIGINEQVFCLINDGNEEYYFNPSYIVGHHTGYMYVAESCLSIPNKTFRVKRLVGIKLLYKNMYGEWVAENNPSIAKQIAYQHEFDHLQGKTLYNTGEET